MNTGKMTSPMHRIGLTAALIALAAGCATPSAQRYFTLDMTPSAQRTAPVNLVVQHIRVADPLVGRQVLIRKSPTELEHYAVGQWAAQLDELLIEKLDAEFGPRDVGRPTLHLSGWLQAFEQIDVDGGAEAHIKLSLTYRRAGQSRVAPPLLEKTYDIRMPAANPDAAAIAATLSRGVETLAEQILADVARLPVDEGGAA